MNVSSVNHGISADLEGLWSDKGVESILANPEHQSVLPSGSLLQPAEVVISSQIEKLLARANSDDFVLAAIKPWVNRMLLRREVFNAAVKESLEALKERMTQANSTEVVNPLDTKSSTLAKSALEVLDEEYALRTLLDAFRNALLQG